MNVSTSHKKEFEETYTPKIVSMWREGYSLSAFYKDAFAGLTVAIVALPLSMAIAIAAGLPPEKGLYTAIIGGFLISALGGSRFQIGGPAGAFIVLMASIVAKSGYDGLLIANLLAGIWIFLLGIFRLGGFIRLIPHTVICGFSAGIGAIIFASQIKELLGLNIPHEPAALIPKLETIYTNIGTITPSAIAISIFSIFFIISLRRKYPNSPSLLFAVIISALLVLIFKLEIATIGSRFGGVPDNLPYPSFPQITKEKLLAALPDSISLALLGAIESLLSALVADGMTGRKHRSNMELLAQGIANIASTTFGGLPVTGTIARTATNIRAGAYGPVSGIFHALYLLIFMLVAAPLASYIPLAALGGVLAIVAWNMAEGKIFINIIRNSYSGAIVLLTTFFLTIFIDLLYGISAGCALSFVFSKLRHREKNNNA